MNAAHLQPFIALLVAYIVGEFALVSSGRRTVRGALWALWVHPALAVAAVGGETTWRIAVAVGVAHALLGLLIEFIPARWLEADEQPGRRNRRLAVFVVRHLLHALVVLGCVSVFADALTKPDTILRIQFLGAASTAAMVWLGGFVLAVNAGARVIEILVEPFVSALEGTQEKSPIEIRPRRFPDSARVIGQWERAVIYVLVLSGNIGAVAFLAAAKSVFRIGDLTDRKNRCEAEFILIGTLMSFTWALFVGMGVKTVLPP